MGMNIAPPTMSREEFEARKAGLGLRRKHENERRVERYMKLSNASFLFSERKVFVAMCVVMLGLFLGSMCLCEFQWLSCRCNYYLGLILFDLEAFFRLPLLL